MLQKGIQSPWSSSVGRLFDAVASISGLKQIHKFEGQAAMEMEFAIGSENTVEAYPFEIKNGLATADSGSGPLMIIDWELLIRAILRDVQDGIPLARIAVKFHNTLVDIIINVARRISEPRIVLTGGCFQNKYLMERSVQRLREAGFRPYWHQRIPPNDGGIALGQIFAAARMLKTGPTN
jgi:hydrogenase maturation protein HypF